MIDKIIEGALLIAMVALILRDKGKGFTALVNTAGNVYSNTVTGLQGRSGGY